MLRERSKLCRFLDAGITSGTSCCGGLRPKSARARSRGKFARRAGGRRCWDPVGVRPERASAASICGQLPATDSAHLPFALTGRTAPIGGSPGAGGKDRRRPKALAASSVVAPRPRMLVEPAPVGQAMQPRPARPTAARTGHRNGETHRRPRAHHCGG